MKLVILFLAMLIANPALAVTCMNDYDNSCAQEPGHSTAGDCTTLGYEKGGDKDCEHALYCPFDSSYARCVKLDSCANLGFTLDAIDKNCKKTLVCKEGGQTYRLCADYAKNLPTCADMGYVIPKNTNYPGCKSYKNCPLDSNFKRCETASSCTDLGFTNKSEMTWCKTFKDCPTDSTKGICLEPQAADCEGQGFTKDSKPWCRKLAYCPTDSSYTICKGACQVGDVYYSNGSCGAPADYNSSSPTPWGIVYSISSNGLHGRAVILEEVTRRNNNIFESGSEHYNGSSLYFGFEGLDTSLTNYTDAMVKTAKTKTASQEPDFYDGKGNTEILRKTTRTNELVMCSRRLSTEWGYYWTCMSTAADAAYRICGTGNNGLNCWLPSLGEMYELYGSGTLIKKVDESIQTLKDKGVSNAEKIAGSSNKYFITSTEADKSKFWVFDMQSGESSTLQKSTPRSVRFIREF